jgi:hypothetical protein
MHDVLGMPNEIIADTLDQAIASSLLPTSHVVKNEAVFVFPGINALAKIEARVPFVVSRRRQSLANERFDQARALYCLISSDEPRVVTASRDGEHQASRAFAAELFAPEAYLRRCIKSRFVSSDDAREIAKSLRVSPRLVERQIENHQLAEIMDA